MTVGPHPRPGPDDAADDEEEDPTPRRASRLSSRDPGRPSVRSTHSFSLILCLSDLFPS
jgi:hypothetical protein